MKISNMFLAPFRQIPVSSVCLLLLFTAPLYADIAVRDGGSLRINAAAIKMNCSSLSVSGGGVVDVGDGAVEQCGDLTIQSGSQLSFTTGEIHMNGTFLLDGLVSIGTGVINFTATCGQDNLVGGSGDYDGDGLANENDPDNDDDGMPDEWEIANALNFLSEGDAADDLDGDGYSNLAEYLRGTDPWNADAPQAMPWIQMLLLGDEG